MTAMWISISLICSYSWRTSPLSGQYHHAPLLVIRHRQWHKRLRAKS